MTSMLHLDYTLADLFRKAGVNGRMIGSTHHPWAHIDIHPHWPRESCFAQDEDPLAYGSTIAERERFCRSELEFWPMKGAFVLGNMEVILFRSSANSSDLNHPWGRLPPEQRPQARFIDLDQGLAKAKQQLESITDQRKLVFAYPCEWMDGLECVVDPSLAFRLESKRFLCQNNIPTPTLEMLSLHGEYLRRLETKELPFVVKFPQASSSYGTFLVTSSKQRKEMLASVERFRLRGGDEIQVSSYVKAKHNYCVQCFVSPDLRGDQPLIIAVTW